MGNGGSGRPTLLHVVGDADGGRRGRERERLREDARHQEFLVVLTIRQRDRAAEHVGEQQHEHD